MNDEHPIIHVYPGGTPTDAELQAERDTKHQRDLAEYHIRQAIAERFQTTNQPAPDEDWPITEVIG